MFKYIILGLALAGASSFSFAEKKAMSDKACPDFLNHEYRQLHTTKKINLCNEYRQKPLLVVNTASYCGYTKQFGGLEALHQKYQSKGLRVVGFASNDFNQEDSDEAKTASVCYENFGVTFTMLAPTKIKGAGANPTFAHLAQASKAPSWNFNKYLVMGDEVTHYGSRTKPLGSELEEDLNRYLK